VAVALIVGGLVVFILLWNNPQIVPNSNGPGEWRGAPRWLRPLVRRTRGPVLLEAVAGQAAATITFVYGVLRQGDLLPYPLSAYGAWFVALAWGMPLVVAATVALRARRWRR
jgi:hypothetical protein